MSYELWLGDCLEEMDRIEAGSVDMICADLPYGTTACKWDVVIPFEPLWKQYKRVIKKRGAVVLFGSEPFSSLLICSNLKQFKYKWVWDKVLGTNPQLANIQPMKTHEDIIVFGSGLTIYNPQKTPRDTPLDNDKRMSKNILEYKRLSAHKSFGSKEVHRKIYTDYYPVSILKVNGKANELNSQHRLHPTQKPVALLSYLIKTYTNPGELVLDNTCGSGSTLEAAELTGRNSIGIEKDAGYYQIAVDRLERVRAKLSNEDLPMFKGLSL